VVGLSTDLHGFSERCGSSGQKHEFLECKLVSGMRSAVDNVESRGGEDKGRFDTSNVGKVLVKRDTLLGGRCLRDSDGDTEDSISTELSLVCGTIELDEEIVDFLLVHHGDASLDELWGNDIVHVRNGLGDTYNLTRQYAILMMQIR